MNGQKIKVLIADDSPLVREVLKDMIEPEQDLKIVGEAVHGREAVEMAKNLMPDIITMDVMMPVMNGLEAVEEIMAYTPTPILVFSSAVNDKEMDVAFEAIARGALEVLEKPKVPSGEHYERVRAELLQKLRLLSRIHVIPHIRAKRNKRMSEKARAETVAPEAAQPERGGKPEARRSARLPGQQPGRDAGAPAAEAPRSKRVEEALAKIGGPPVELISLPRREAITKKLVVIGSSTGGPKALVQIFRRIPADFPLPILVVQHIAHSFDSGLVGWLNRESPLNIVLAENGSEPKPGTVHIATTGSHMVLDQGALRYKDSPPVNSCRPSVDVLFESVAAQLGSLSVGVILTGMGRDGADGLKLIRDRGGATIVQDQDSSVIFGMPKAAIDIGAADQVLPLSDIAQAIARAITR